MNRAFAYGISIVAAAMAIAPAQAATTIGSTTSIEMVDLGGGVFSGGFSFLHRSSFGLGSAEDGAFLKQFTFSTLGTGLTGGSITTSLQGGAGITFAKVLLNGQLFSLDTLRHGEIFDIPAIGTNTLDVYYNATSGGRFQGDVSFAGAVPEPTTWGLMILGIGGIGFAMRRQQKQTVKATVSFA